MKTSGLLKKDTRKMSAEIHESSVNFNPPIESDSEIDESAFSS